MVEVLGYLTMFDLFLWKSSNLNINDQQKLKFQIKKALSKTRAKISMKKIELEQRSMKKHSFDKLFFPVLIKSSTNLKWAQFFFFILSGPVTVSLKKKKISYIGLKKPISGPFCQHWFFCKIFRKKWIVTRMKVPLFSSRTVWGKVVSHLAFFENKLEEPISVI